ncbi:MAG: SPOR domain-containing protein [Alphaproteobacteria bacterium]|nr:SPOR domain-containing protein [Alphaproteobacteria bacterium]
MMLNNWYGRSVLFALAIVVVGAFGGTYYYAYQRGLEDGRVSLPPVILADRAPLKIMNTDKPKIVTRHIDNVASGKGDNISPADSNFGRSQTSPADSNFGRSQTSPADSNSGAIESLLDNMPSGADTPAIVAAPKKPAPAKPKVKKAAAKKKPATTSIPKSQNLYMVQLLAVRNPTQALSAYRRLQTKHKDLLTGREPLIKRVDLGAKGIYHRVNVPSFPTKAEAIKFCKQLKSQKQNCLVKKQL